MKKHAARSRVVSSFTIIKGSLIEETYDAFRAWDLTRDKRANLADLRDSSALGRGSAHWGRDVSKVLNRRLEPAGRDRPLVQLAKAGCALDIWKPLLLWHITRDEFMLRDFLLHWLYPQYTEGAYRLRPGDLAPYLQGLLGRSDLEVAEGWAESTTARVATALLRMAVDFGLLRGTVHKEFASYHLPEEALLYLLHAMAEDAPSARRLVAAEDWRMYLMDPSDVERELLRLHQFRKVHYDVAGSLSQLDLSYTSAAEYAREELCT